MLTVKAQYNEETMSAARELLTANMEMLHRYTEGSNRDRCRHCGQWLNHAQFDEECPALLRAALQHLVGLVDTPHTADFLQAVPLEAAHQIKRWGVEHDEGKEPQDWFWVIGYLAGKCLRAALDYERTGEERHLEKAKHHTVSTAAVMLNWFRRLTGDDKTFRPGIAAPPGEDATGESRASA